MSIHEQIDSDRVAILRNLIQRKRFDEELMRTFPPRNNDKDYKSTQSILTDTLRVKYCTPKMRVLKLVLENEHVS